MNKAKKRALIIIIVCVIILIGAFVADRMLGNSYLKEIKYDQLMEKIDKKENFVLLLSQTTCSHCKDFKPKLTRVANKNKITVYYIETNLLNQEQHINLMKHFNFEATPTTVFVINGEEGTAANRINGDASEEKIINKLKSNGFID